jgi:hypothetical protein
MSKFVRLVTASLGVPPCWRTTSKASARLDAVVGELDGKDLRRTPIEYRKSSLANCSELA